MLKEFKNQKNSLEKDLKTIKNDKNINCKEFILKLIKNEISMLEVIIQELENGDNNEQ